MKIVKIILYWIMVAAIVTGAVYSYQKVQFGRNIAMLYQLATGNTAMGGPGGGPPGGGQMDMGRGGQQPGTWQQGQQPGMESGNQQGQMQSGQTGFQSPQMEQNTQGSQMQGAAPGGGDQQQFRSGEGGNQGPPQMGQNMQGSRPDFQEGGRQGGPHGGGPGGGKWYKISLRNVGPYACLLAFFILITTMMERCIKGFSSKRAACTNNAA